MISSRRNNIWRRIGWGALIVLALLIIAAAVGLWLGPPRDPKSFAVDNSDFGLGFRVGDPWNPDAYENAMKANGFVLGERENVEDLAKSLKPQEPKYYEYPFYSVSWQTADGCLGVLLTSDNKGSKAKLRNINLSSSIPEAEWGWKKTKAYWRKVKEDLAKAGSKQKVTDVISEAGARETALRYPQTLSDEGVGFGSTLNVVRYDYGKPLLEIPFSPGSPILGYFGDRQSVTFFFANSRVNMISIDYGYRNSGIVGSAGIWYAYLSFPYMCWEYDREIMNAENDSAEDLTKPTSTPATDGG